MQTMPYRLNEETGIIDYDMLEKTAKLFRPKLLVAGELIVPHSHSATLSQNRPSTFALLTLKYSR